MKQYKHVELVGNTKKLPRAEKQFYDTLISFRKLPECAQLFLPLQIQSDIKSRYRDPSPLSNGRNYTKDRNEIKRQCSREDEEVQSYAEWKFFISWMRLSSWKHFRRLRKSCLYILPVGPFPDEMLSSLVSPQLTFVQALINFGEAFFMGLSIKILPVIDYKDIECRTRLHKKTGQLQLFLPDLMEYLSTVMPKNAVGIIALSWIDFYPDEQLNSILGEGSVHSSCAAMSFGHYAMYTPPSRGYTTPSTSQSVASEKSAMASVSSKGIDAESPSSYHFSENKFAKSLLSDCSRRKVSSTRSLNIKRASVASNSSMNYSLSRSASSYKHLGSLSSIENSWTKLFSRSIDSLCSISTEVDASYDIINRDEADEYCVNLGMEEDVVKLALPLGCKFFMSCSTIWRLFREFSHEVCHIFGLSHCSFYECAMNNSHRILEVDEQPIFLCPICLRKLQKFLKFRLVDRYWRLTDVYGRMQPCYSENIHVSRDCCIDETTCKDAPQFDANHYLEDYIEGCRESNQFDVPGHICIEVTREKNEGYDIINLEYKKGFETGAAAHDCHFADASRKLENIVSFLNRY